MSVWYCGGCMRLHTANRKQLHAWRREQEAAQVAYRQSPRYIRRQLRLLVKVLPGMIQQFNDGWLAACECLRLAMNDLAKILPVVMLGWRDAIERIGEVADGHPRGLGAVSGDL
jgi:hypothetical protein